MKTPHLHFTQNANPKSIVVVKWDEDFEDWVLKEDFSTDPFEMGLRAGNILSHETMVHILMHGCTIVPEKMVECQWCGAPTDIKSLNNMKSYLLCDTCKDKHKDKTGYCGISCCMTGKCDGSC